MSNVKENFALKLLEGAFRFSVSDPANNLGEATAVLRENPDFNIIIPFNHISYDDPVGALWLYRKYIDPNHQRKLLAPASHFHTDTIHKPFFSAAYSLGAYLLDYRKARIVQSYQIENPKYGYTHSQASSTYRTFLHTLQRLHAEGPYSIVISPEGHRSEDEQSSLQKAEDGIIFFARKMAPCVFIPIGIVYERPFKRDNLNLCHGPQLRIAKPILQESPPKKVEEEKFKTDLMVRIGSVLPPSMWGYYRAEIAQFKNQQGSLSF